MVLQLYKTSEGTAHVSTPSLTLRGKKILNQSHTNALGVNDNQAPTGLVQTKRVGAITVHKLNSQPHS